jgi:hypothetical protein
MDAKAEVRGTCVVCEQLAEADGRYMRRLRADRQMRHALVDALVVSMGFCHDHRQRLREADPDTAAWSEHCESDATSRLAELFARTRLQDEFLQDLLFGARARCPACLFSRRLEGRLLSRMVHDLEGRKTSLRTLFSTKVCFEHARQLVGRTEGSLRTRMKVALRKKGEQMLAKARAGNIADEAGMVAIGRMLMNEIYPGAGPAWLSGLAATSTADTCGQDSCPVCAELERSQRRWLESVAENIRLGQPAWLTLPTCADHVITCLRNEDSDCAISVAQRYVEASLAPPPRRQVVAPGRKRRRRSHRWFHASVEKPAVAVDTQVVDPGLAEDPARQGHCPGCQQNDVAMRRAVFSFLRVFSRASESQGNLLLGKLCLKHLAEVLIYAPDEQAQVRLVSCLNELSLHTPGVEAIPAFGEERVGAHQVL